MIPEPTEKERKKFFRTLTHGGYIKDFTHVKSTPEKPFRFIEATIMECDEWSNYKELVGKTVLLYLHGITHEDGSFEVDYYCTFETTKTKGRILVTGKVKKEHLDI